MNNLDLGPGFPPRNLSGEQTTTNDAVALTVNDNQPDNQKREKNSFLSVTYLSLSFIFLCASLYTHFAAENSADKSDGTDTYNEDIMRTCSIHMVKLFSMFLAAWVELSSENCFPSQQQSEYWYGLATVPGAPTHTGCLYAANLISLVSFVWFMALEGHMLAHLTNQKHTPALNESSAKNGSYVNASRIEHDPLHDSNTMEYLLELFMASFGVAMVLALIATFKRLKTNSVAPQTNLAEATQDQIDVVDRGYAEYQPQPQPAAADITAFRTPPGTPNVQTTTPDSALRRRGPTRDEETPSCIEPPRLSPGRQAGAGNNVTPTGRRRPVRQQLFDTAEAPPPEQNPPAERHDEALYTVRELLTRGSA